MTFGEWWCLRWHKGSKNVRRLSAQSDYYECPNCDRRWAINHNVRGCLPYDVVREIYERD